MIDIVDNIRENKKNINLIYAFNATGKTRLSVAYKNKTKDNSGNHTGVYYNAFSEDLFVWDNDEENNNENIKLEITYSSLNQFHYHLSEDIIREKLQPYNPNYDFYLNQNDDPERGYDSILFYLQGDSENPIKISRGEERIFVWCFFLALFEADGWADQQNGHFFIDDPVSSLDDHNIFITVSSLFNLIDTHFKDRKVIVTTHHIGFFSILADWLTKGGKSEKYKDHTELYIMSKKNNDIVLNTPRKEVFLYHLHLLKVLQDAKDNDELFTYHFVLLRQLLENIASFLGSGQFGYVLNLIGVEEPNRIAQVINDLSHKNLYYYQINEMGDDNKDKFIEVFDKMIATYRFKY